MLYWENKPNGTNPPTASGYYLGYYFEFYTTISSCNVQFAVSKLAKNASFTVKEYCNGLKMLNQYQKPELNGLFINPVSNFY